MLKNGLIMNSDYRIPNGPSARFKNSNDRDRTYINSNRTD